MIYQEINSEAGREQVRIRERIILLTEERDALRQQSDALRQERDVLRQERDALFSSTSWRVTKPLRWARHFARKLFRLINGRQAKEKSPSSLGNNPAEITVSDAFVPEVMVGDVCPTLETSDKPDESSELNIYYTCLANYLITKNIDELDSVPYQSPLAPYLKCKNKIFNYTNVQISEDISFSIILPTYNRACTIIKSIDSVLRQTYDNFELIIIDDGSSDNTEELIKDHYSEYLKTGKIIYNKIQHSGVSVARNVGIDLSKNRYIAYVDSDNIIKDYFLEVFAYAIQLNPNKKTFYCVEYRICTNEYLATKFNYHTIVNENYIDIGTFVHNYDLIGKYGKFDEQLKRLTDYDLILRYTRYEDPLFVPVSLVAYNDDPNDSIRITNNGVYENFMEYIWKKYANLYNVATCIITYNHQKYISQAIESALIQKGIRHTIYIFDDSSDDMTSDICRLYADKYENIKYIRNKCRIGLKRNIEQCFHIQDHDFIALLEGNDYWTLQTKLLQQACFLLRHPETSMVFSTCRFLEDNGNSIKLHKDFNILQDIIAEGQFIFAEHFTYFENLNPVKSLSCTMFRRCIVNNIQESFYNEYSDETSLCFFHLQYGNIGYINTPSSVYRI